MPAVPLDEAGKFVAGAYVVFVGLILVYVAIMAAKVGRIERELRALTGLAEERFGLDTAPDKHSQPSADAGREVRAEPKEIEP